MHDDATARYRTRGRHGEPRPRSIAASLPYVDGTEVRQLGLVMVLALTLLAWWVL